MTFPRSHDRRRLEGSRLREVASPTAGPEEPRLSRKRPHRAPRRKLSAALRARVDRGVVSALSGIAAPDAGAQVARVAVSLYRAGQLELRTSSPMALSHLLRWAVGTATAQHLAMVACDVGPESDRGRELLELSMRLEGRAERASVAALSFARALGAAGRTVKAGGVPWLEPDKDDE